MRRLLILILGLGSFTDGALAFERLYATNPSGSQTNWYPSSGTQAYQFPRYKCLVYDGSGNFVQGYAGSQLSPGASAQIWQSTTYQEPYYTIVQIATNAVPNAGNPNYYTYTNITVPNETTVYFNLPIWPPDSTPMCTYGATVVNPTAQIVQGYWKTNGVTVYSQSILPNSSGWYVFTYPCSGTTLDWGYSLNKPEYNFQVDPYDPANWLLDWTNTSVSVSYTNFNGTNPPGLWPVGDQTVWQVYQTNGPVNFTGQTNTAGATEATLQAGVNRIASGQDSQLDTLKQILKAVGDANGAQVNVTNSTDVSAITNHLAAIHQSLTNHLWMTNQPYFGYTNIQSTIAGATNAMATLAPGFVSNVGALSNMMALIPVDSEPTGLGSSLSAEMVGHQWNFNPLDTPLLANLFAVARRMFGYLLCAAYLLAVLRRIVDVVKAIGTAQQGSVPNVELSAAGFGGNFGVLLAAAIVPIFLVLMAGALAWISTGIGGMLTGEVGTMLTTSPFTDAYGAVATGIELARHFFPFGLALSLLAAYGVWYVGTIATIAGMNVAFRLTIGG